MPRLRNFALLSIAAAAVFLISACQSRAQFDGHRYVSPPAHTETVVGGKHISIRYYAPSMHGRKIFGGLVPYGEVWCTGANYSTDVTTESELEIGGLKLPGGTYSIWTLPTQTGWTLIINNQTGVSHLDYEPSADFGRTKMSVKTLPMPVETFRVELRNDGGDKGTLALLWETTEASIPFTVRP